MSFDQKIAGMKKGAPAGAGKPLGISNGSAGEVEDPELAGALRNFRSSVHAWSEAAYYRQRPLPAHTVGTTWRRVVAWGLSCTFAVAIAGGGLYERHHQQEMARIAAVRQAEEQQRLAEERAREAEDLLARVDSDVSREVPNALEPLAQLMAEDESR